MYRVAQIENRRGWVWAGITLITLLVLNQLIQGGFLTMLLGALAVFILMGVVKHYRPVPQDLSLLQDHFNEKEEP
jgi:hypothetical protein